jgi:hypothetical protein
MAITFNAERLIGRLNILESAQFQYAGTKAMEKLGFELRSEVGRHMAATYKRTVPFTVNSTKYTKYNEPKVGIYIETKGDEKGQSPASYLYPTSTQAGGMGSTTDALVTRFTKALRKRDLIGPNQTALNWRPSISSEPLSGGYLKSLLTALGNGGKYKTKRAKYAAGTERVFVVAKEGDSKNQRLRPGVYRVKSEGGAVERIMMILDKEPKSRVVFDFEGVVRERSQALLPGLLRAELARALR